MTRGKRIALRRKHKAYTNKAKLDKSVSLVSLKKSNSKNEKICIKENSSGRNISNYLGKKLRNSCEDNFISLNLRNVSPVDNKQNHEEVKNQSSLGKSEITKKKMPDKVQDEKLLVSPIVLLEILSEDRIKKTTVFEKINVPSVTNSASIGTTKKSSHRNLRKYVRNKAEIQDIFDKQICISKLGSNANEKQKLANKSIGKSSTRFELKISHNPVLDERINNEDTDDPKVKLKNNEVFNVKETLCPVNKNVECDTKKERHLKQQIEDKQEYFNQSTTNIQENSTHRTNAKISINCDEQKNCKDKHMPTVNEIIKDFTKDEQIIFEKKCAIDSTLSEKSQNLNECFTEYELCINKLNKDLLDSKVNNETSIIDDKSIESHGNEQIGEEVISDNVVNDTCNDDEDDEEIIFYYINSANEVVKKVDVNRKSSSKIEKIKDDKVMCSILPAVDNCLQNISISQPAINNSKVIINVENQNEKDGSKKTINTDKIVLTTEEKDVTTAQSKLSVKNKTLDDKVAKMEKPKIIDIYQPTINKKNENMEVNVRETIANDDSIDIIQPINTNSVAKIIVNQTVNTTKDKTIINNETFTREKERTINLSQPTIVKKSNLVNINLPIVVDNSENMEVEHCVVIEKDQGKNVYQSEVIDKTDAINNEKPTVHKKDAVVTINQPVNTTKNIKMIKETIVREGEINYTNSPATIDKAKTINLKKPVISNVGENIDVNQLVTTENNEILNIDQSVYTEKYETLNTSQAMATKKNVLEKYRLIIEKNENLKFKQSAVNERTDSIEINHIAVTEKDKTNTLYKLVNTEKDKCITIESITSESDEIPIVGQHMASGKDIKMKANKPLITENEENTNFNRSLIIEPEKNIYINQSSIIENEKNTSSNQLVNDENIICIEIDQPPITQQNKIISTKKLTSVETNPSTVNETDLVDIIKVEEIAKVGTDQIADDVNLHKINGDITGENIMSENIKVEVVDIPEDNIDTEIYLINDAISNQNTSINAVSTQDIRESDTLTASEDERNDASIRAYDNDENNHEQQEDSALDSESTNDESMDRSKAMFINFMEAYQRMKRDIAVNSLLSLNGAFNDANYADIGSEILHISDNSDNEDTVVEQEKEDILAIQKPSTVAAVTPVLSINPVNSVNLVNPIRRKILLPNGGAVISASKLYGCGDGISVKEGNERSFPCPKCARVYKGETTYRKHKKRCTEDPVLLSCILCLKKVKHKRSLVEHLRRVHKNQVMDHEIKEIVNDVVKEAKFRKNTKTPIASSIIELPEYVKLFCNRCGKIYDCVDSSYYRECGTCSVSLLIFCQRCDTRCVVSPRISIHLNGDCKVGEPIKCPHCDFVSSQRHHIYQHIEDAHKAVPPTKEPMLCNKGCGRKFDRDLALRRHEKHCGTKPNLRCKFCKYKTRHRSAIKMHMQQHVLRNDTKLFERSFSDSDTSDSNRIPALEVDENSVRNLMKAYCSTCKVAVPMPPRYVHDCITCRTRLTYNCNRCYLVPSRSHDYRHVRVHVIRCHAEKVYKCSSCNRRFAYYYDYNYHKSNCDKNMSFRCNLCPYKSNMLKGLQGHMRRIHPNGLVEIHHCSQCSKNFSTKDTLQRHLRLYCGVEPNFSCAHCEFRTKSKFSLIRHIQNKHSEIFEHCRFQCVHCQKVYSNLYAHDTHVTICPEKPH
ncbi:uncharacterized protein LOC100678295 isoform X1 [Nasonia vitripennis]|uniref:C2H2-type domain-containing protein n=2 Tax=Nasonia vitripennis TaxID=7425 RepID=A0A7M7H430_NASVI|nr:uncharacterized protein LOC100678295 isoform X1 [Nasonia vitripennis]